MHEHIGAITAMSFWLMKSEPTEVSVDDVLAEPDQTAPWFGIRNYQARNFMRDAMRIGDGVFFYHSSCANPGIVGIAEVASTPYPDPTQFDRSSHYFDPKASLENPRWVMVDVRVLRKVSLIPIAQLRAEEDLADMQVLQRGNRLSISRVSAAEWRCIIQRLISK